MSIHLTGLLERRSNLQALMHEHLDKTDAGAIDAAAEETYQRYHKDMSSLDDQIKVEADMVKRNRQADEIRAELTVPAKVEKATPTSEDIFRSMARGERRSYDFMPNAEQRVQTHGIPTFTGAAGGFTVRTDFWAMLSENMRVNAALLRLNPTVITTEGANPLQIPRVTTHAGSTATWIAEGAAIGASDAVFAQATLNAYKNAFTLQVSAELEADTSVNLAEYFARRGGESIGNSVGAAYVVGTGVGQPTGINLAGQTTAGVTGAATVAGAFTADNLIDLYFSVIEPYRMSPSCGWLLNDITLGAVRKLKDGAGRYLFDVDAMIGRGAGLGTMDSPISGFLLGKPVVTDPNVVVPAALARSVLFGDWRAYYVRNAGPMRVERSVDFAFNTDLVTWRFITRTDGELVDSSGAIKHFVGGAA